MTLLQLRDELAPTLREALRRQRPMVARIVPWPLVLQIALWVLQLLSARLTSGRPTITALISCTPRDFDPVLRAAMEEAQP